MSKPRLSVRADCNARIGYGHVMRCLAVSRQLLEGGASVQFVMAADSDSAPVEALGLAVLRLDKNATNTQDLVPTLSPADGPLLLDSYEITTSDLEVLHDAGFCVAMFDDGKRLDTYPCDLIIDSAPAADGLGYQGLATSRFCLGCDYVPLREEFTNLAPRRDMPEIVDRVLITFGGSDHDDQSARTLEALRCGDTQWQIDVILGPAYCGRADVLAESNGALTIHRQVKDMAALMSQTDMAISSSGGTALELTYLGVPMILLGLSDDQVPVALALAGAQAAEYLGYWDAIDDADILDQARALSGDHLRRSRMNTNGRALIDGGGAKRIADEILNIWKTRPITAGPGLHSARTGTI